MSSPALIWIDVQGYEGFVYRGAGGTLAGGLPTVSEVWPYGILRAGMTLEEFCNIVNGIWSDYWVYRRQRVHAISNFRSSSIPRRAWAKRRA